MALCKTVLTKQGYETNYHKISELSIYDNTIDCVVSSYVSKEYREKQMTADRKGYSFEITVEEEESMGIRQLAYKKLKELPEWADAENC